MATSIQREARKHKYGKRQSVQLASETGYNPNMRSPMRS